MTNARPNECVGCGRLLDGDRDEEPDGAGPSQPLCGDCRRARDFDALLLLDDELDD